MHINIYVYKVERRLKGTGGGGWVGRDLRASEVDEVHLAEGGDALQEVLARNVHREDAVRARGVGVHVGGGGRAVLHALCDQVLHVLVVGIRY